MEDHLTERKVAMEAIATLAKIKAVMVERILKPAGVPQKIYAPLLRKTDEATGRRLSKRQVAPLILDAAERESNGDQVARRIVHIAATWTSFELADDEYMARATVQKARELLGTIQLAEARDRQEREAALRAERDRRERERAALIERESQLLLMMFDEMAVSADVHRRGYLLQDLLNRLFNLHGFEVFRSFSRNGGGEQIDGAYKFDGWHYLVECRWRRKLSDTSELDGLRGKISRSGRQTMGLFVSINGWSDHVPSLLRQNPDKCIMLMEGYALRAILTNQADLTDLLSAMAAKLSLEGEPYLPILEYLDHRRAS